ncbi:hypothetical protein [Echinicola vietnamensis]|uniref:Uncharacterized protein n=1 Tax=Echinicola vietnamensis (strain DSM 17526 / LMG 23754 / KMM 6221) TaxID=926556 RepID=L0G1S1_ECHVK|nr:hypothetical protein [Echinicola vietnamensis]AGA80154.1 hypothetical protein Echvi_3944 [Echinicola vietnamensis DSM 17526]
MINYFYLGTALFVFCFLSQMGHAQHLQTDLSLLQQAYKDKIPFPQETATGGQYEVGGTFHVDGTPFLVSSDYGEGAVNINGEEFDKVLLNLDVVKDQLITYHPRNYQQIILDHRKVQTFQLVSGRKFIQLPDMPGYTWHYNGYYEVLWEKDIMIISKHYKEEEIKKDFGSSEKSFEFENHEDFFIKTSNGFRRVTRKKHVVETMGISKKQINKILRQEGLRFKKNTRQVLIALGNFYTSESINR